MWFDPLWPAPPGALNTKCTGCTVIPNILSILFTFDHCNPLGEHWWRTCWMDWDLVVGKRGYLTSLSRKSGISSASPHEAWRSRKAEVLFQDSTWVFSIECCCEREETCKMKKQHATKESSWARPRIGLGLLTVTGQKRAGSWGTSP